MPPLATPGKYVVGIRSAAQHGCKWQLSFMSRANSVQQHVWPLISSSSNTRQCLDKLARYFADLELSDLEPPVGSERIEEFLDFQWGARAARTYNKNLSILHDFFVFQVRRGKLKGDPTLVIERAKARAVLRTTFTPDDRRAILASNPDLRDKVALRLLLATGYAKGRYRASSSSTLTTTASGSRCSRRAARSATFRSRTRRSGTTWGN